MSHLPLKNTLPGGGGMPDICINGGGTPGGGIGGKPGGGIGIPGGGGTPGGGIGGGIIGGIPEKI